jgi:hypothetical protein
MPWKSKERDLDTIIKKYNELIVRVLQDELASIPKTDFTDIMIRLKELKGE